MYNVTYCDNGITKTYLGENVDYETAVIYADRFKRQYVGKPYPNGKGYYPFTDVRVERVG